MDDDRGTSRQGRAPEPDAGAVFERTTGRITDRMTDGADDANAADLGFLRSVLSASGDCIKILDLDGKLTFMTEAALRAMEVPDFGQINGCAWPDFWEGERQLEAKRAIAIARDGGIGRFRGFARTFAGNPRWWDVQVTPIRGPDGRPERLLSVSRDVTAEALAQAAQRERGEQLQLATEAAAIGIWDYEPDTSLLRWDARCKSLFGLPPDAIVTYETSFVAALHPDDRDRVEAAVAAALAPDGPGEYDIEYRAIGHEDGILRWIAATGRTVFADGRPARFAGTVRDVSRRRADEAALATSEAALRALNETLEQRIEQEVASRAATEEALHQAQKMEAVGQLTGGIAHDFNNLLTGISGSLELIRTRAAQGRVGDIDRYARAAQEATNRATALTQRLLAFSRRQALEPKPTDLEQLVAQMRELICRTMGPHIAVEAAFASGSWTICVDPNQLENALLNLCINARDAMPAGGRLTIETANLDLDETGARAYDLPPGQYVTLSVSDSGTGMSTETASRAFEPFFTTKPAGRGTGLGLSMIYGFARQSGGHARIYSELGQGTTVRLYLPRHVGPAEPRGDSGIDPDPAPIPASGETVLLVDDEPIVRMTAVEALAELGYTILEAGNGADALAILGDGAEGPRIDLLVTDIGLPGGMNGIVLAERARALRPGLEILFISGYGETALLGHGHLEPGMHVLTKPFAIHELTRRIRTLLEAE